MIKLKKIINNLINKINNYSIKINNLPNKKYLNKEPGLHYNKIIKIFNLLKINLYQYKLKNILIKSKN